VNDETKVALKRAGFREGRTLWWWRDSLDGDYLGVLPGLGEGGKRCSLNFPVKDITATLAALATSTPSEAMRDFTDEELDRHEAWIRSKGTVVKRVFDTAAPPTTDLTEAQLARVQEAFRAEMQEYPLERKVRFGLLLTDALNRLRKEVPHATERPAR
jgi:hypothetical protein